MWVIVQEPSGVKSLVLRGRIANGGYIGGGMDAACRGSGAIAGAFSGPGCGFGVFGRDCHREQQGRSNASR